MSAAKNPPVGRGRPSSFTQKKSETLTLSSGSTRWTSQYS